MSEAEINRVAEAAPVKSPWRDVGRVLWTVTGHRVEDGAVQVDFSRTNDRRVKRTLPATEFLDSFERVS